MGGFRPDSKKGMRGDRGLGQSFWTRTTVEEKKKKRTAVPANVLGKGRGYKSGTGTILGQGGKNWEELGKQENEERGRARTSLLKKRKKPGINDKSATLEGKKKKGLRDKTRRESEG